MTKMPGGIWVERVRSSCLGGRRLLFRGAVAGLLGGSCLGLFGRGNLDGAGGLSAQEKAVSAASLDVGLLEKSVLSEEELEAGWIRLFDGSTLMGWEESGEANWEIVDGEIRVSEGEKSLLVTTTPFADYELRVEFKADASTNSGIFLHTPKSPKDPARDCYELNIAPPDNPFPTGGLVGRVRVAPEELPLVAADGWRQFVVKVVGASVSVQLDGKAILNYVDPAPLMRGQVALQHNQGSVAFRNVMLRPLGGESLIPIGEIDRNWITSQAGEAKFSVAESGALRVEGGKGQLESRGAYADFSLQLKANLDSGLSNSGLFFRCIPGESLNGYECQLHQGIKDGDRTQPLDGGLGAIFRRQNARCVIGEPQKPFFLTLIASGAHLATWVNGIQVTDVVDVRKADANPRKGLRLEGGPLMIQGHDPGTRITIESLRIADWSKR